MAPSPSSGGRTPSTRGRGRGRPRLRGRANSLLSGRRRTASIPVSVPDNYTPTGRRRPVYQNGYRPGGAGGGGRYIDHSTGSVVPASVYNITHTPMSHSRRRAPVTPSVAVADGVYKPREEKSYIEFHPDLDVDAMLECLSAEDVDGVNYKHLDGGKSVKIVDVKEEVEPLHEDRSTVVGSKRWDMDTSLTEAKKSHAETVNGDVIQPKADESQNGDGMLDANSEVALSSFAYSTALYGATISTASIDEIDIDMSDVPMPTLTLTTEGVEKHLHSYNPIDLPIDPALAALTPPPPSELTTHIPIDPALSQVDHHLTPQSPAITPTEETTTHPSIMPGLIRSSRRGDDGPTLASLRAHRSNAGKPPIRQTVAHPQSTVRRPRNQTTAQTPFEAEKLNLPKPSCRKITPFQFSEFAWSFSVGSTGPYGLNNPPKSYSTDSDIKGKGQHIEPLTRGSVDRSMVQIGYQQTSLYTLPSTLLRDVPDLGIDEELNSVDILDRVEYDMDEQDDKWLTSINSHRLLSSTAPISREVFEITMTKIEKEWVALEKKIPKVIAKPHSTPFSARRRRTTGDDEEEEEGGEDSKCAICDDGECENSNAIVFCDGCNLAVHQECYGVPYIPEGQWLCRKCLTIPRQTAHCIFCPNTDGAFKQTTTTRWSHLLCAIWIPEVRLANPAYMEPVDGMELVPKSRWRLTCYICKQKMGACIQCSNKSCFIAFHVTCGRRARLHMKMKNTSGPGAQLEASGLKAYCDKHVPADWRRENDVDDAVMDAMEFYQVTMAGRNWGDSQSAAMALPDPSEEHSPPNGILVGGNLPRVNLTFGNKRKRNTNPKPVWKLPSGAPVIPHIIYTTVVDFLSRFKVHKKQEFVAEACKYWTLKREARRGASLLKRLQLQMNSFTSVEVTRRNFAAMGHTQGTKKLEKRKEFADGLIRNLERLKHVTMKIETREREKAEDVVALKDLMDSVYFPEVPLMRGILDKAESLDHKHVFEKGFTLIRDRLENRLYPTVETFAIDIRSVLNSTPSQPLLEWKINIPSYIPPVLQERKEKDDLGHEVAVRILEQVGPLLDETVLKEVEFRSTQVSMPANGDVFTVNRQQRTLEGEVDDEIEISIIGKNLTGVNGIDTNHTINSGMSFDDDAEAEDEGAEVEDAEREREGDAEGEDDGAQGKEEMEEIKEAENDELSSVQFTKETIASPKKLKAGSGGINGVSTSLVNMNMSVPAAGTTVLGYWTDGRPPWYMKDNELREHDIVDSYSRKTPTPTPRQTSPIAGTNGEKSTLLGSPKKKTSVSPKKPTSSPRKKASVSPTKEAPASPAKKPSSSPAKKKLFSPSRKTPLKKIQQETEKHRVTDKPITKVEELPVTGTSIPQRTEVVPKTPEAGSPVDKPATVRTPPNQHHVPTTKIQQPLAGPKITKKSNMDLAESEDLMGGYRSEDLPSPLGISDGSNPSPDQEKVDSNVPTLPALPQSDLAAFVAAPNATTNGVADHENTSVLSDPPDDDDVDIDAEGSTEDEGVEALDKMDVDVGEEEENEEDEDLDAEGEEEELGSETGGSKGDVSPGSSSGGSAKKSRKGMVFARQSNGRFGSMKTGGGAGREGGGGWRGRGKKKRW